MRGIVIEAKLVDWNIDYAYDPAMALDDIKVIESAQVRSTENAVNVEQSDEYAEHMRNGAVFPTLLLFGEDIIGDGNQRFRAAKKNRYKTVPVFKAYFANIDLAIAFAASMNRRTVAASTPAEAQHAAMNLLRFGHTEESVARELGYSRTQVAYWRKESAFADRARAARVEEQAEGVDRTSKRKLADIKLLTPFAAATELVASVKPAASAVTDLVKAVTVAPSEAEAIQVVADKTRRVGACRSPPHRVRVPRELSNVRRALPMILKDASNPIALVETDPTKRDAARSNWVTLRDLSTKVLGLYGA